MSIVYVMGRQLNFVFYSFQDSDLAFGLTLFFDPFLLSAAGNNFHSQQKVSLQKALKNLDLDKL